MRRRPPHQLVQVDVEVKLGRSTTRISLNLPTYLPTCQLVQVDLEAEALARREAAAAKKAADAAM
jgi:hypothetical protein